MKTMVLADFQICNSVPLKIYKINQRLKLWARVSIAVCLCPAAAHRRTDELSELFTLP